jgi:hypothetical protein
MTRSSHPVRSRVARLLAAFTGVLVASASGHAAEPTVFTNVNVLTMTDDQVLKNQSVWVANGIIRKIGPSAASADDAEVRRIDARGMYLMPGLIDGHSHLDDDPFILGTYLSWGVTTVRDMWGRDLYLKWRDEIRSGARVGPDLYIATGSSWTGLDVDEARAQVRDLYERGYDHIKLSALIDAPVFLAVTAAARALKFPVTGHYPRADLTLAEIAAAGMRSIEHADEVMWFTVGDQFDEIKARAAARIFARNDISISTVFGSAREYNRVWSLADPTPTEEELEQIEAAFGANQAELRKGFATVVQTNRNRTEPGPKGFGWQTNWVRLFWNGGCDGSSELT